LGKIIISNGALFLNTEFADSPLDEELGDEPPGKVFSPTAGVSLVPTAGELLE
jgi:hypothetical protein